MTTDINKLLERLRTYYGDDLACRMLLMDARHALEAMAGEVASLQNTFDLMWKADQRAIKLWQEATGKDHIWPDKAKTTLWLLERLEAAEADRDRLKADVDAASAEAAKFICKNTELKLERDRLKAALDYCNRMWPNETARKALGDAS